MGQADRPGYGMTDMEEHVYDHLFDQLREELKRAITKHAPMNSPHEGHSVIEEEMDELWDHVKADTGRTVEARKEAMQIAAMALRYVVDVTRLR